MYRCITGHGPDWTVLARGERDGQTTITARCGNGPEKIYVVSRCWYGVEHCEPLGHCDGGVTLRASKPEPARARFELLVEYHDGSTMESKGTRREMLADFETHVGDPEVFSVEVTRNGVTIRDWPAEEEQR